MTNPNPNVSGLQEAAQIKHLEAVSKVEQGIKKLLRQGKPVTIAAVAQASGVSRGFIHNDLELKAQIDNLKARQNPRNSPTAAQRGSNTSKDAIIDALRYQIQQLRKEIDILTSQFAENHPTYQPLERYDLLFENKKLQDELELTQTKLGRAVRDNQELTIKINQLKSQNKEFKARLTGLDLLETEKEELKKQNSHVMNLLQQATSEQRKKNAQRFADALRESKKQPDMPEVEF